MAVLVNIGVDLNYVNLFYLTMPVAKQVLQLILITGAATNNARHFATVY